MKLDQSANQLESDFLEFYGSVVFGRNGIRIRLYFSEIPTCYSHFNSLLNSHFLLSRSENTFLKSGNLSEILVRHDMVVY